MIDIQFPDKATMYDSPCANCMKKGLLDAPQGESLLVSCDKSLCYDINTYSEMHPTVNISGR